jgi:uncharacterized membrane protein YebE (DUF533 family)
MEAKFLKIVLLAAVSDGEIQSEEIEMLNQIKNSHPSFRDISDDDAQSAMADVYNKVSAGMEIKHILDQLENNFSENEKHSAYALAKEVCVADFNILPAEKDFLNLLSETWKIPEEIKSAIDKSINLRYLL